MSETPPQVNRGMGYVVDDDPLAQAIGRLQNANAELAARYEELRHAAQEAIDAREWAIRYDHGEPDRPIMTMVRLKTILRRQAPDYRPTFLDQST